MFDRVSLDKLLAALRDPVLLCGAKTRAGGKCRNYAMRNGRCRLHGGLSRSGAQHGRYKHGKYVRSSVVKRGIGRL